MTIEEQVKPIIENLQKQMWEAEHFISINIEKEYWIGRKDSIIFTLDGFRAVGISVSEVTSKMQKPNFN